MILQQLERDADRLIGDLPPPMYDVKPVKWVVHLDQAGRCQGIDATSGGEGKRDRGKPMPVPFKNRQGTKAPALLLADKRSYTWGTIEDGPRSAAEHQRYLELLQLCADQTGNRDVSIILDFLSSWDANADPLPTEMAAGDLTTFAVEGRYPIRDRSVQDFWARKAGGDVEGATTGQCLVCGQVGTLAERLPVPIMGLPGRPGGVQFISGDLKPAESHGLREALSARVCRRCGERFGKATNALISGDKTHLHVGNVCYIFWAPDSPFDPVALFTSPEEVKRMLESAWRGELALAQDQSAFYATAISVYVARIVVRTWLHTTVASASANLIQWFEWLHLVAPDGDSGTPLPLRSIPGDLYFRKLEKVDPKKERDRIIQPAVTALMHSALHGTELPNWLLMQAVQRNRQEQSVTYARVALIKAVLCSRRQEDRHTMAALNPEHSSPAYHCGRLLAVFEAIQLAPPRRGMPRRAINSTVVDRFFGAASSSPRYVLGSLERRARAHLGQLRQGNKPAYTALSERLEEVHERIADEFPAQLGIRDQALFALGFYHQRAYDRMQARIRMSNDRTTPEHDTEEVNENE